MRHNGSHGYQESKHKFQNIAYLTKKKLVCINMKVWISRSRTTDYYYSYTCFGKIPNWGYPSALSHTHKLLELAIHKGKKSVSISSSFKFIFSTHILFWSFLHVMNSCAKGFFVPCSFLYGSSIKINVVLHKSNPPCIHVYNYIVCH